MAIINLDEETTMRLIYNGKKVTVNKFKYKYNTKFQWLCLGCGEVIFTNFISESVSSIYCDKHEECKSHKLRSYHLPNLVEAQYFKRMKTQQYKSIISTK